MHISAIYQLMGGDGGDTPSKELYQKVRGRARRTDIARASEQYDYRKHKVASIAHRPPKTVFKPSGDKDPVTGEDILKKDYEHPTRAPLSIQQYIITQKASFAAGNGVRLRPSDENSQIFKDVHRNWHENKSDFYLRTIAKRLMGDTQVAVIFYGDADKDATLDDFKFKFIVVSPSEDGSLLEPVFDEYRRLTAIGREYKDGDTGKQIYDLYIDRDPDVEGSRPVLLRYRDGGNNAEKIELPFVRMPVVYWEQERPECDSTEVLIEEWETSFSDFLTQMGYTADPILFGKGRTLNLPAKGSAGKFVEGSEDADLKYVTPADATTSRELQFKLLQKYVFFLNRAVVLDLDTMQSLSEVSGAALDRYLIDPYMDATDRQEGEWGLGVQRMVNWLVKSWRDLRGMEEDRTTVEVTFTKYRVEDVKETVEMLLLANGQQPIISHQGSVGAAGLADDPVFEFNRIMKERREREPVQQTGQPGQQPPPEQGNQE